MQDLYLSIGILKGKELLCRSLFNKEFVKPGNISEEHGDFYNRIFGFRQRADYEDFVEFDHEKVKNWIENAKKFINSVEKTIQKSIKKNG